MNASPPRRRPPKAPKGRIGGALGGNPLLDTEEHTPAVSPYVDAEWRSPAPAAGYLDVNQLPEPHEAEVDAETPLSAQEKTDLRTCEAALEGLRLAFIAAGRGLQVIRDGRLYRDRYATFDDYVEQRWGIQRSYAHKLIRAWPLGVRVQKVAPQEVNESQVRQLLPIAARHGDDAALTVYETIAAVDGVRVTTALIKGAAAVVPDEYDRDETVERVRAYVLSQTPSPAPATAGFEAARAALDTLAARIFRHADQPEQVRGFVDHLRGIADELERVLTDDG